MVAVPIRPATPERLPAIAAVLGRAFVAEPMMRWPLGAGDDLAARLAHAFEAFDAPLVARGLVWEAGEALGAAGWIPPGESLAEYDARAHDAIVALADDGGRRWDAFWEWVEARSPSEP